MPDIPSLNVFSNTPPDTNPVDADTLNENFETLRQTVNALDGENLAAALAAALGVSGSGVTRRGKAIIPAEETVTSTTYVPMPTPDDVPNVVLPTDGLIVVTYRALWKESVDGAGRAALFLSGNQVVSPAGSGAPVANEALGPAGGGGTEGVNDYGWVLTGFNGLTTVSAIGDATPPAAPMLLSSTVIEAAAGTYSVRVLFKSASGSVTAKGRKLWVEARGYG